MVLSINGMLSASATDKRSRYLQVKVKSHTGLVKDDLLHGRHENYWISIDPKTNRIVDGQDILERMKIRISVCKLCTTCDFKIITDTLGNKFPPKKDHFPVLSLRQEKLCFTMKRGRQVHLINYYGNSNPSDDSEENVTTQILLDRTNLLPLGKMFVDISKFTNLDSLTRRLKTIMVFQ